MCTPPKPACRGRRPLAHRCRRHRRDRRRAYSPQVCRRLPRPIRDPGGRHAGRRGWAGSPARRQSDMSVRRDAEDPDALWPHPRRTLVAMTLRLWTIDVDAHDPRRLGQWWADALGWKVFYDADDEFVITTTDERFPGI